MNKELKFTIPARGSQEFTFQTGVDQIAITNYNGVDGSTIVVTEEITKQHSGDLVSFIDGADAPFADFTTNIEAVQSGSGDPSPDNVRPIIGFNAVNVGDISDTEKVQYFKGLLDGTYGFVDLGSLEWSDNSINNVYAGCPLRLVGSQNILSDSFEQVPPSTSSSQMVNGQIKAYSSSNSIAVCLTGINVENASTMLSGKMLIYELATPTTPTITPTEFNMLVSAFGLQGWLVQIAMPTEAGTVYGGQLKPLTGELIVTHDYIASYNGETINEPWISSMDVYSAGATPTTGAQVVYPLTTPVTYQLTPTEVRSLLGVNNVWADCGPVDVRYFVQSTQPMIDYIDEKTTVFFDAQEDLSTYDVSLIGATSTDVKNCLLANKNANIIIRVKRYSTVMLYYLREYSPNYFADFASHAAIFDAEGTKSMRIDYLRLDLTQETSDFTDDYIILPTI